MTKKYIFLKSLEQDSNDCKVLRLTVMSFVTRQGPCVMVTLGHAINSII